MTSNITEKKSFSADWLARIPNNWNVSALKRVLSGPLKYGATESGDCDDRSLPRYLRITDFENDGSLRSDTFASLPEEIARDYWVNDGDVLFARSGATVGKTFLFRNYQGRACFAGYLIKASTLRHKLTPEFLYYFTKSPAYEAWKDFIFTQATIQNIGADKYSYLPICLPPLPEQQRIVAYPVEFLYRQVLSKEQLLEALSFFLVRVPRRDAEDDKPERPAFTLFPRYHQSRLVRKISADITAHFAAHGDIGKKYLADHSAGSGKTLSICWLADHLHSLFKPGTNEKLVDITFILTDRKSLDTNRVAPANGFQLKKRMMRWGMAERARRRARCGHPAAGLSCKSAKPTPDCRRAARMFSAGR